MASIATKETLAVVEEKHSFYSDETGSRSSGGDKDSGSVTHSSMRSGTSDNADSIKDQLTKRETEAVFRLRIMVVLILISAATAVSLTVFFITKMSENEEFEIQYEGISEKVIQSFEDIMVEIAAVSGLAVTASAQSLDHKMEWPFVTLSSFQQRAGNARFLSKTLYVSINPIVADDQLPEWETFVKSGSNYWIQEGYQFQEKLGLNDFADSESIAKTWLTTDIIDPLHTFDHSGRPSLSFAQGPFLPRWQTSPVLKTSMVNENLLEKPDVQRVASECLEKHAAVLSGFVTAPEGGASSEDPTTAFFATLSSMWAGKQVKYYGDPMAHLTIPVFDRFNSTDRKVVAILQSTIHWRSFFQKVLPSSVQGIRVVVENRCDGAFTYEINGLEADVIGFGDHHDPKFDNFGRTGAFRNESIADGTVYGLPLSQDGCPYEVRVYPSQQFYNTYHTTDPITISVAVAVVFLFTISMFFFYDRLVERRQKIVLAKATQSTAIVSSLFPKQVRDRLMAMEGDKSKTNIPLAANQRLKTFLNGTGEDDNQQQTIADLFPNCTVFFADIAGFTAWSSTREPAQVFILLQTVYQAFDSIAKRRRVFKVETIGDSYVAVTGLPEPQANHAVIMAKFSWDCLIKVGQITKELEVTLGPDTGDLHMRFGLHSGPVTAGVLRGDRARFQLFGDTVNTASRMESTGVRGKIQISQATADCLKKAGKSTWITDRDDTVKAKGKGVLHTHWLCLGTHSMNQGSVVSGDDNSESAHGSTLPRPIKPPSVSPPDMKKDRLVDWMADLLLDHMKKVVAVRKKNNHAPCNQDLYYQLPDEKICLDEVKDAIKMPKFDAKAASAYDNLEIVNPPMDVVEQMREYVALIADSYRDNPFHNWEHACHVTMSVNKLLKRIVAPDLRPEDLEGLKKGRNEVAAQLHDFTHGITSDPMAVFAITFSALIHDVDHQGISNAQLMKEEPSLGEMYRGKSLAEQNSLDVAWDELMSDRFTNLRCYMFGTKAEMMRFRQLIVNTVLATDIFDKELNDLRKSRWERAFSADFSCGEMVSDLRATIVMEHIIQASDVSHTMQHWHVYQKWNKKLFTELYKAFRTGRMAADPSTFWYKGELGFFDNYIIPLAKKLKDCNVFGVSSDEYLNYAVLNRAEWEERGQEIVQDLIADIVEKEDLNISSNLVMA